MYFTEAVKSVGKGIFDREGGKREKDVYISIYLFLNCFCIISVNKNGEFYIYCQFLRVNPYSNGYDSS